MRQLWLVCIVLSLAGVLQGPARAYELKSLDAPVPAVSGQRVEWGQTRTGSDFHATLAETIQFQGQTLPEGTQFIGHMAPSGKASRSGRVSPVAVWVDTVIFPNGHRYTVYPNEQIRPHFLFKPRWWGNRFADSMNAGEKIWFRFSPAAMRGMLQTGALADSVQGLGQ